jgi:hypothetical protein
MDLAFSARTRDLLARWETAAAGTAALVSLGSDPGGRLQKSVGR